MHSRGGLNVAYVHGAFLRAFLVGGSQSKESACNAGDPGATLPRTRTRTHATCARARAHARIHTHSHTHTVLSCSHPMVLAEMLFLVSPAQL